MSYIAMTDLTWPEAEALRGQRVLGLLPTGSLEQHGPQLPLFTDSLIASELGRRVAGAFAEPVVVAPVIPGGLSSHHLGFPGSLTLPEDVFGGAITAFIEAFERMGIREVAIFSAHGGNFEFLERFAAEHAERRTGTRVIAYTDFDGYAGAMFEGSRRGGVEPPATDLHAGAVETSQGLALFPDIVRPYAEVVGYTAGEEGWLERMQVEGMHAVSANGVLGDPSRARVEAGEPIFEAIAAELSRWIAVELGYEPVQSA